MPPLVSLPQLALMDESTSALDTGNEARMYEAVAKAGITYVSVGHRPTLEAFHDVKLELQPGGQWTWGGAVRVGAGQGG